MKLSRLLCLVPALGVFVTSRGASALELGTSASDHPYRSSQNFALELRFAPYHPQIDDEPDLNGKTPYADSFGDVPRFYFGIEFDWQAFRIPFLGTLGPGIGLGRVGAGRNVTTVTGRASADTTDLTIYPIYGVAVLRADVFFRDFGFPLVPYGKAGIATGIWRATNSAGTSTSAGVSGKGVTWGENFSLGLSFMLDSIDPGASRNMDNATGINTTSLFFEGTFLALNGIGQDHPLRVGSTNWTAGMAFEF